MSGTDADSSRDDRFDEVVADYLEAVAAGREPDENELLARYPDLAASLRAFIGDHRRMGDLFQGDLSSSPSDMRPDEEATLEYGKGNGTSTPAAPAQPEALGDYVLLEKIAEGGMGVVYKARQQSLNRLVALKMIRTGQFADAEEIRRFHTEAEAAARLDHPGIVPIYQVGVQNGLHYFSMAYVKGPSLADLIRTEPMAPQRAAEYVYKVARAVAFAHENGIIHRDIKPANVLLDEQDEPKVTDFGLAKQVQTDQALTYSGQVLGTAGYMPPEQASGATEQITVRSDVYSLGALLYALLTRRPPFQAENPLEVLLQVLSNEPPPPSKLRATDLASRGSDQGARIPTDLETICLKCLEKDPAQRYATAQALAEELARFLEGKPIQARPVGAIEHAVRWCRRKPATAIAICLMLLITLTAPLLTVKFVALRDHVIELTRTKWLSLFGHDDETTYHLDAVLLRNARQHYANLDFPYSAHRSADRVMGRAAMAMLLDKNETLGQCKEAYVLVADRLTELVQQAPEELGLRSALADCYVFLGSLHRQMRNPPLRGEVESPHVVAARQHYRRATDLLEELCAKQPDNLHLRRRAASVAFALASVSDHVQATETLLRSDAKLAAERDRAPAGIIRFDLEGEFLRLEISQATERLAGRERSLSELRQAVSRDAGDLKGQLVLADALRRSGNHEAAWERYQLAFQLFSLRQGEDEEHEEHQRDSLQMMDHVALAYRNASRMLREMGRHDDALATIQKAIALRVELTNRQPEIFTHRRQLRNDFLELAQLCLVWPKKAETDTPISNRIWPSDPVECYYAVLILRTVDSLPLAGL